VNEAFESVARQRNWDESLGQAKELSEMRLVVFFLTRHTVFDAREISGNPFPRPPEASGDLIRDLPRLFLS
jgi:hypothetical protein